MPAAPAPIGPRSRGVLALVRDASEPTRSDQELVTAARAGNPQAKEALYRRHVGLVIGMSHRILGRRDEVDDAVQDVFLSAFENLGSLRDPAAFRSWLAAIVVRVTRMKIRRNVLLRRFGMLAQAPLDVERLVSDLASPEVRVELRTLYAILDDLPALPRIALVLRRVEGMSIAEIAEHMASSESTVKRHIQAGETLLAGRLSRGAP